MHNTVILFHKTKNKSKKYNRGKEKVEIYKYNAKTNCQEHLSH